MIMRHVCTERLEYNYRLKLLMTKPNISEMNKDTVHDMAVLVKLKTAITLKELHSHPIKFSR